MTSYPSTAVTPMDLVSTDPSTGNRIEIVGVVVPEHVRDGSPSTPAATIIPRRTRYMAYQQHLVLQVVEEDGVLYTLPVNVPVHLPEQQAALTTLTYGDRVRVVGHLRTETAFDRRFATRDNPDGRPTSLLVVAVTTLMPAIDADVDGSWLCLTGRISTPPALRRHERTPTDEVARTSLVVESIVPSRRPGSQQHFVRIDRIPLDIPLRIAGSTSALRAGNLVAIEGRLESFQRTLRPHTNAFVKQHLAALEAHWQTTNATVNADERAQREQQQLQHLRRLQTEQRLRVRAGYVALLDGEPMTIDEARTAHATFVDQQKQRRRRWHTSQDATHPSTTHPSSDETVP